MSAKISRLHILKPKVQAGVEGTPKVCFGVNHLSLRVHPRLASLKEKGFGHITLREAAKKRSSLNGRWNIGTLEKKVKKQLFFP